MLGSLGYRAVEKAEDRVLSIAIDGYTHYLYIYDDDDLQLYFGLTGYDANAGYTPSQLNEWISVFDKSAREFHQFVNDADRSE